MKIRKIKSSYDKIANEYYSDLHLTSRNFDTPTREFFKNYNLPNNKDELFLELGVGKGRVHEFLDINSKRVIYTDISRSMLLISPKKLNFNKIQCDAIKIPFRNSVFSGVFAFLYDPYNLPGLYREIYRVLKNGALFIGTLPHFIWGKTLRKIINIDYNTTIFKKFNSNIDEYIILDSYLMSYKEIKKILSQSGFTRIYIKDLLLPKTLEKISNHILNVAKKLKLSPYSVPIVMLIIGEKT